MRCLFLHLTMCKYKIGDRVIIYSLFGGNVLEYYGVIVKVTPKGAKIKFRDGTIRFVKDYYIRSINVG